MEEARRSEWSRAAERWVTRSRVEIAAFALGSLWAFFWVQGIPFFSDDHTRWLGPAVEMSWGEALAALFDPWGPPERTWGFAYRPAVTLWFKALYAVHGPSPAAFFAWKCAVFGGLTALAVGVARRHLGGSVAAAAVFALLLASHGIVGALLWHGDLSVLANLLMLGALALLARELAAPRLRVAGLVAPVFFALVAMQTKGNAKLFPVILIVAGVLGGASALRRAAPVVAVGLLFAVPVRAIVEGYPNPLSPSEGIVESTYTWRAASLEQVRVFAVSGALDVLRSPLTLTRSLVASLFPLGWLIAAGALGVALARRLRPSVLASTEEGAGGEDAGGEDAGGEGAGKKQAPPSASISAASIALRRMVAAWALLSLASMASYPDINPTYQLRYGIDFIVPWSMLLGLSAAWASSRLRGARARRIALASVTAVAAAHAFLGLHRSKTIRSQNGAVIVVAEAINRRLAEAKDVTVRAYIDYAPYEYWPRLPGRELTSVAPEALSTLPQGTYAIAWQPPLVPEYELVLVAAGRAESLFDRLFTADPSLVASLLRKAPPLEARAQAQNAMSRGSFEEAAGLLEQALRESDTPFDRNQLALAYFQMQRPADALSALAPLVGTGARGLRNARYNHALALLLLGRAKEAYAAYQDLARELPRDVDILYNMGVSARGAGNLREASAAFTQVLRLSPGHAGARANLAELRASTPAP
jgi:tetratricopeptide (TPR) repeat protein